MTTNKIMSTVLSSIGIPLDEMTSNLKSDAARFLRDDATIDQIGIHLYKYIFFENNSSIVKELKAFLQNVHISVLTKQSIKDGEEKTKGLNFSGDEIMRFLDGKSAKLHAKFIRSLNKKEKANLVNTELSELENFSEIGFSLEEFEHPVFGTHFVLKFRGEVVCDSVPS